MNVDESIKFLSNLGYRVYKNATVQELIADKAWWRELTAAEKKKVRKEIGNQPLYKVWGRHGHDIGIYTARKLIDFAMSFKRRNGAKSTEKGANKSYNRARTRHLIANEDFDAFPQKGDHQKLNPWNWD